MAALVKHADLRALDVTVRTGFMQAYEASTYTPRWPLYATRQASTSRRNIYPQAIDAASIREWIDGERVINSLVLESASVTNQLWELSYGFRRIDLDDDLSGAVNAAMSRLRSGAGKYQRHPDKLVTACVVGNTTCLDGLALFHASHKVNPADPASATFGNTASGALTPANAAAARASMLEYKAPDGDVINEDPRILLVPPALELTARKVAQADIVVFSGTLTDNAESNVYKGMYDVVVDPRLGAAHGGSDSYWYLVDATDPEDRALIFQEREAVEIVSRFSLSDPGVFDRDEYTWGTRARYTAAAGNPKKILRRTG